MSLAVHLHGGRVGTLQRGAGNDYTFAYEAEVVADAGAGAVVLSHSLPVREEPYDAISTRIFFDALLPESSRREEVARELRIDSSDGYGLLAAVGRDCAGAVVIVPETGDATRRWRCRSATTSTQNQCEWPIGST